MVRIFIVVDALLSYSLPFGVEVALLHPNAHAHASVLWPLAFPGRSDKR